MRGRAKARAPIGEGFNLIENLLALSAMESTDVPPNKVDGHVRFNVRAPDGDKAICFLIHVDEKYDGKFGDHLRRPDYLCICLRGGSCICTVIELKTSAADEAPEQIMAMAVKLKQAMSACLPSRMRMRVQGIIVTGPETQTPGPKLDELMRRGTPIRHHITREPADWNLWRFVSRQLTREDMNAPHSRLAKSGKYSTASPRRERGVRRVDTPPDPRLIVRMVRGQARKTRVSRDFQPVGFVRSGSDAGICVEYRTPGEEAVILHASVDSRRVGLLVARGAECRDTLAREIEEAELNLKVRVMECDEPGPEAA